MVIMSMDDSNDEIELEEVSKIFRCNICSRCYLSLAKFSAHFPVYHAEKIVEESSPRKLTFPPPLSVQQIIEECERERASNQELDNNESIIPQRQRQKISLKSHELGSVNVENVDEEQNVQLDNVAPGPSAPGPLDSQTNLPNQVVHENEEKEDQKRKRSISIRKRKIRDNTDEPLPPILEDESYNNGNDNNPVLPVEVEADDRLKEGASASAGEKESADISVEQEQRSHNEVEVITLTDSDEEGNIIPTVSSTITATTTTDGCIVKQELLECSGDGDKTEILPSESRDEIRKDKQDEPKESNNVTFPPLPLEKKFFCTYCGMLFTRDRTLQGHIKGKHKAELEDKCSADNDKPQDSGTDTDVQQQNENGKRNPRRSSSGLKRKRQKEALDDEEKPANFMEEISKPQLQPVQPLNFSCKWCDNKFETIDLLKRHAINVHIKYKVMQE